MWRWRMTHEKRAGNEYSPAGAQLLEECEAFLAGRYLDRLDADSSDIPGWAWLSVLAHSSPDAVAKLMDDRVNWASRPELLPWRHALRSISGNHLNASSEASTSVLTLQRAVLVPLELLPNATHLGPAALARAVSLALSREVRRMKANPNGAMA
jgi:hypothetical protein